MIRNILLVLVGLIAGSFISASFAKYEASNNDVMPVVAYGYNGTALVTVLVDSNGVLQTN